MNEERQPGDESEDPLPEAADDFAESGTRDVRIEGRTARATDHLDEDPKPDKNVQETPD